jgi:AcrR family transcriptional regulator
LIRLEETRASNTPGGRREEILQVAEALLREEGLSGFSMRAIADRVGIKLASLQYHFPSKGELMEALVERSAEMYHADLVRLLHDLADRPLELFEAFVDYACAANLDGGNLDFQIWALAAHEPVANAALDRYMVSFRALLFELMKAINPGQNTATRWHRAALISTMIEGCLLIVGEGRVQHDELGGIVQETRKAALLLAMSD